MDPLKLFHFRNFAATLLDYTCNGAKGRDELDEVYQTVVEHRDGPSASARARYSSCADLAHWLYFRLGVRAAFLNRTEHRGWIVGANLNRWVGRPIGPNPYAFKPSSSYDLSALDAFGAGDVVVINNAWGGHVMCVTHYDPGTCALFTAEYGKPGGKLVKHNVEQVREGRDGLQLYSGNPIIALTRLEQVLDNEELAAPDVDVLSSWQAEEALEVFRRELVPDDPETIERGED